MRRKSSKLNHLQLNPSKKGSLLAKKKKKKAKKKSKKKAKKKKKKQKYSSGFLKAVKELELVGVIKETKKNTFKLVKNKHEKEETFGVQ